MNPNRAPLVSRKSSLEFWHEFSKRHSLKERVCASKLATNGAGDAPISHRDDRLCDQRADAAEAGLHAGGGPGSQGAPRGADWQRSDFVHRGLASSAGRGGQGTEPGRTEEVLPDREARNDLGVVSAAGGAELRHSQQRGQGRPKTAAAEIAALVVRMAKENERWGTSGSWGPPRRGGGSIRMVGWGAKSRQSARRKRRSGPERPANRPGLEHAVLPN